MKASAGSGFTAEFLHSSREAQLSPINPNPSSGGNIHRNKRYEEVKE